MSPPVCTPEGALYSNYITPLFVSSLYGGEFVDPPNSYCSTAKSSSWIYICDPFVIRCKASIVLGQTCRVWCRMVFQESMAHTEQLSMCAVSQVLRQAVSQVPQRFQWRNSLVYSAVSQRFQWGNCVCFVLVYHNVTTDSIWPTTEVASYNVTVYHSPLWQIQFSLVEGSTVCYQALLKSTVYRITSVVARVPMDPPSKQSTLQTKTHINQQAGVGANRTLLVNLSSWWTTLSYVGFRCPTFQARPQEAAVHRPED